MVYKGPDCPPSMGVGYNTSSLTTKRNTFSQSDIQFWSKYADYRAQVRCNLRVGVE